MRLSKVQLAAMVFAEQRGHLHGFRPYTERALISKGFLEAEPRPRYVKITLVGRAYMAGFRHGYHSAPGPSVRRIRS